MTRGFSRAAGLSFLLLAVFSTLPLCGCAVATYGLGVATMVNDMKVRQREDYAQYRAQTESSNQKPLSFQQWLRRQKY